jgi:hypothetical protein
MEIISFHNMIKSHEGQDFLVYCPGKNLLEWKGKIDQFISETNPVIIGCNRVLDFVVPHYHLFLNKQKYQRYGGNIHENSVLMLNDRMSAGLIERHKPEKYIRIDYTDRDPSEPIGYGALTVKGYHREGVIQGYYRTTGNIAIMISHLMGAKKVYAVGMSGFSYNYDGNVHSYEKETKERWKSATYWHAKLDKPVHRSLDQMKAYGIDFKIITPTIYDRHYDASVLGKEGQEEEAH